MTVVARKTVVSLWTLVNTTILVQAVGIGMSFVFAQAPGAFDYFWLVPIALTFPIGPISVCIGLLERRKEGVTMFFDRDGICWECSGALAFFWLPVKRHYYRIKWGEILGAKLVHGSFGNGEGSYTGPVVLIGVGRCESMTPAELKSSQEFVLTNLGRPPWERTLAITNYEQKLWNPEEIVAQIEQTLGDKTVREQWGDPPSWMLLA